MNILALGVILLLVAAMFTCFGYALAWRSMAKKLERLLDKPLTDNHAYNTGRLDAIRAMLNHLERLP